MRMEDIKAVNKVFIDTSVFIRFFTRDSEEKYHDCEKLFQIVEEGLLAPYTSSVVLMEIIFVLARQYKFPKDKVIESVDKLLQMRNLTLIENTYSLKALRLFEKYNIKYQDCLIAVQLPAKVHLITYDSEFSKVKGLKTATPGDFSNP